MDRACNVFFTSQLVPSLRDVGGLLVLADGVHDGVNGCWHEAVEPLWCGCRIDVLLL